MGKMPKDPIGFMMYDQFVNPGKALELHQLLLHSTAENADPAGAEQAFSQDIPHGEIDIFRWSGLYDQYGRHNQAFEMLKGIVLVLGRLPDLVHPGLPEGFQEFGAPGF